MSIKRMISGIVAAAMMLTMQSFVYAEDTIFSTVNEFIADVINVSLSGITSSTMDDAMSDMNSKLSISDGVVSYNGSQIGYWESSNSSTLYADSSKEDTLIQSTGEGYDIKPQLLKTLLTDVNNQLIENYVPTSNDWSKIIGKYDITLGGVTIPADQWIKTEASTDGTDPLGDGKSINISNLSGITFPTPQNTEFVNEGLYILSYLVDNNGKLFLQNQIISVHGSNIYWNGWSDTLQSGASGIAPKFKYNRNTETEAGVCQATQVPLIKAGLMQKGNGLYTRVYATDSTNSNVYGFGGSYNTLDSNAVLYNIEDPSAQNACSLAEAKAYGIIYFTGAQAPSISSFTTFNTVHDEMFESHSCSKLVRGNTLITKRIAKLDSISSSEFLTIKNSGWYVADGSSIDVLIGNQNIISAGDTADINAVAEVESLSFNVIVPTTLPIYMDSAGVITTATNATVVNKSNASVKMTDITITAKDGSGWTIVEGTPSPVRDAMEFSFTTSLVKDTVLVKDEVLPFSYNAELSPLTVGTDSLDLATVSVTVDWAD